MSQHTSHLLFLSAALLICSGCAFGTSTGTLNNPSIPSTLGNTTGPDVDVSQYSFTLSTVLDFRVLRLSPVLEMTSRQQEVPSNYVLIPGKDKSTYSEQRVYRLEVPVLGLWDFEGKGFGLFYPGTRVHRQTVDIWLRAGTPDFKFEQGYFVGASAVLYRTGSIAIALSADYRSENTKVQVYTGGNRAIYEGDVAGPVIGLEITLGAGEYALDIFKKLLDIDKKYQENRRR